MIIRAAKKLLARFPGVYAMARTLLIRSYALLAFVPDPIYLRLQYRLHLRKKLDLTHPRLFNEKLQWLKLHLRDDRLRLCADKVEVKRYVAERGLAGILIPTHAVFSSAEEILTSPLPRSFIMKLSTGSGFNVLCNDVETFDRHRVYRAFRSWMKTDFFLARREWAYFKTRPRVLVEELLVSPSGGVPEDIRVFCFHGRAEFIAVDLDSVVDGKKTSSYFRHVFDREWRSLDVQIEYPRKPGVQVARPENLELILETAELLANPFPFCRVDLYSVGNKLYFGELTFYHASGYQRISPPEFEEQMGRLIRVP